MRRFWIEREQLGNDSVTFDDSSFHHIFHVCRLEVGSKFEVLVGDGQARFVEVTEIKKKSAQARVLETRMISPLKKPHLVLALSVPRFQKVDHILEKAVELGVQSFLPFASDHSFVRSPAAVEEKRERWLRIIRGATQQCGRGELMELAPAETLELALEKFNRTPNAVGLFPYEGETRSAIRPQLEVLRAKNPEVIWIFVGSEGGFSAQEVELFSKWGLTATTLGPQILRVETACLALLSIIKYEMNLMEG